MLLALTVTYLLSSAANQSLTDRFNSQLLDAAQSGASGLIRAETEQLQALRAIAFTQGFAEALSRKDSAALTALASPQAINDGLDRVVVVSKDGQVILALPAQSTIISADLEPLVQSALNATGDTDKASGLVANTTGGDGIFYTAGPVRQG